MRLAILIVALAAGLLAFYGFDVLDTEDVRGWIEPFGGWGPVAYVPIAAVLGALLVPGPLLAGVSGLLFGAGVGTLVTVAASVGSAVLALLIARQTKTPPPQKAEIVRRHGIAAVAIQRLTPGVPDAPMSYAFGVAGLSVWQIAAGTALGSAPRAFSYTALGASLDDPDSPVAVVAIGVFLVTVVVGAELARRSAKRLRSNDA